MVRQFPTIIISVAQCLFHLAIFFTSLILTLYYKRFYFILLLFLTPDLGSLLYLFRFFCINSAIGMQNLFSGSCFFYLVLRRHLPVSHEFHGQSGQRHLIQTYSFYCQLMLLVCDHWFSIFSANLPMDFCSELVVFCVYNPSGIACCIR